MEEKTEALKRALDQEKFRINESIANDDKKYEEYDFKCRQYTVRKKHYEDQIKYCENYENIDKEARIQTSQVLKKLFYRNQQRIAEAGVLTLELMSLSELIMLPLIAGSLLGIYYKTILDDYIHQISKTRDSAIGRIKSKERLANYNVAYYKDCMKKNNVKLKFLRERIAEIDRIKEQLDYGESVDSLKKHRIIGELLNPLKRDRGFQYRKSERK
jgi:hypothetical protein